MSTTAKIFPLLVCLICLLGCEAGRGDRCAESADCGSGLLCFAPTQTQSGSDEAIGFAELEPYLEAYTCVSSEDLSEAAAAAADAGCRSSHGCKISGRCTPSDGKCIATSDADCRGSHRCSLTGRCTARDGDCVASSDEDCRATTYVCEDDGRCTAQNGGCVATSDEDCRRSTGCDTLGRCSVQNGKCIAASDEDCRGSAACKVRGACTARAGLCRPS